MSVRDAFCALTLAASALSWTAAHAAAVSQGPDKTDQAMQADPAANQPVLRGLVTVRGNAPIAPGAVVTVSLEDVSLADAPAISLGKSEFAPVGKSPYGYTLRFDENRILPGHRYSLRAEIRVADRPVAMSAMANMKAGAVPDDTGIVVDPVAQPLPGQVVGAWTITHIGAKKSDSTAPAFMTLRADGSVSGTGGCNRMMGRASVDGTNFTFGPTAGTRMACPGPGMSQEEAVYKAMQAVRSWERKGDRLILRDAQGKPALTLNLQTNQGRAVAGPHTERSRKSP